ncbi:MAG TPA: nitroreductase family protein [Microvirga sp.]|jgi:nitroreductase/FMN reductase [NAD(P)H]|nr:nitroreductase family protein [Microvirga sp.]
MSASDAIGAALRERFGEEVPVPADLDGAERLARIAGHRVCRRYSDRPVEPDLLRLICACALSSPSKSDLQQRDIVVVRDRDLRRRIADLLPHMPWVGTAPAFLVVCLNGRRIVRLAEERGRPFPNDHLDLLFNATGDAAIALTACLYAAEAIGMGGCPISEVRNHAETISAWLGLPERVVPFAGLCLGWPADGGRIAPRLPLALTLHEDRYAEEPFAEGIAAHDARCAAMGLYAGQRAVERWGEAPHYGWSEDKTRQYAEPHRADFGAFVRAKGFSVE